jgi:3-dehydroquinate synthase
MTDTAVRTVRVALDQRGYDVVVGPGLLSDCAHRLDSVFGPARFAIVTDGNVVAAGHLQALQQALATQRLLGSVVLPPGEATKCFGELARLTERLLELGVERGDALIALGGGVVGDLTGFAAAILRRGVRFGQIPTTLLAHVDSSVGGKTGINTPQGKNLVGAFHQPSIVLADISTLATLPDRQLRAGYAEIVKHALLGDAAYFDWLEASVGPIMDRDASVLVEAIARSVEMKAAIVARDETEQGDRMLLNLGHTFGHALEAWAGFSDRLLHGEAVALGTAQAFRFSERRGLVAPGTAERIAAHLKTADLPTRIADIGGQQRPTRVELMRLMAQDKKVRAGRMTFILARGIGEAFVTRDVEPAEIERFIDDEIAA